MKLTNIKEREPKELSYRSLVSSTDRDAWLQARNLGIGASEAASVLGLNPWQSPFTLYALKRREITPQPTSDAMRWGLRLEPVVADAFAEETGRLVWGGGTLLQSIEHPWLLATLDREQKDHAWPEPGVLEIKTTSGSADWSSGVPVYYQIQLQQQLLVTDKTRGSIACLIGGQKLVWADFERHDAMCKLLVEKTREFWDRVQAGDPPDADPSKSTFETLKQMAPTGKIVELDKVALDWHDGYRRAAQAERAAKSEKDEFKRLLAAAMGTCDVGILPNQAGAYVWNDRQRKEYLAKAASWRELRWNKKAGWAPTVGATNPELHGASLDEDPDLALFEMP